MYVLGIDFGGGASKASLLTEGGLLAASAVSEYETLAFDGGGREQRPDDWVRATFENIRAVLARAGARGDEVACVCFDAATHTAVLTDRNFRPVRNSVYWTDTRCLPQKRFLEENYGEDIFRRFKHRADTIWTLPQLLWIRENEPDVWAKTERILFAKDYVRHMFTGDFATDFIEAQGSMLFDFDERRWSDKYLNLLGIGAEKLPQVLLPTDIAGTICAEAAKKSGLRAGTPVLCGTTDTALEVFASGAVSAGQTTVKLATAGRICVVTEKPVPDTNIVNYAHVVPGLYYPGSATKSCASSLRWFRDTFSGEYAQFDAEAEKIPAGSEGLLFHPYLSGELTPYADPELRASFTGISATHTKAHFARSVMEGVALSLKDCKNYLEERGVEVAKTAFIIGGGAKSALWRSIVADALNISLVRTECSDSSFGGCMLAGIGAGFFTDYADAVRRCCRTVGETHPDPVRAEIYEKLFRHYKKTQKLLREALED